MCVCISVCLVAQSCPTLCDPMDCSPPGSSVHGIFQARVLKWVAISSSRGSSQPRDQTCISCISHFADKFFTAEPPGKPEYRLKLLNIRMTRPFGLQWKQNISRLFDIQYLIYFLETDPFISHLIMTKYQWKKYIQPSFTFKSQRNSAFLHGI